MHTYIFKKIMRMIFLIGGLCSSIISFASEAKLLAYNSADQSPGAHNVADGIGGIAYNLIGPVEVVASFLSGMAIIIGLTCLFGAFVRYMQYRVNPLAHPISTVVTLLILGVLLLLLPLIYKLTESGIPGLVH